MDPRSEVVLRQQDYLNGHVLLINAPNDQLSKNMPSQVQTSIWTWNYADHQSFVGHQIDSYFSTEFPQITVDQVIIFVPKSKELLNYLLHVVVSHLNQGQRIFLVGEKKGASNVQPNNYKVMEKHSNSIVLDIANYGKCKLKKLNN